jgi:rhodanese-related sulfurtransferase
VSRTQRILGITAAALGLSAAAADFRPALGVTELAADIESERDHISAIELAERIMGRDPNLVILDLRPQRDYEEFHIPTATSETLNGLAEKAVSRTATIVLYSEGGAHSAQAWVLMRMRGYRKVFFLREGVYEWISRVHEPRLADDATEAERVEFARSAELSRFFGGVPISGVPRHEVPAGYWTGAQYAAPSPVRQTIANIRRRGC